MKSQFERFGGSQHTVRSLALQVLFDCRKLAKPVLPDPMVHPVEYLAAELAGSAGGAACAARYGVGT